MDTQTGDKKREIIPRWRDFRTTVELGELKSARGSALFTPSDSGIRQLLAEWRANPSLSFATDLLGAAIASGEENQAEEAIAFLLSADVKTTALHEQLARQASEVEADFLGRKSAGIKAADDQELIDNSRKRARHLRHRLKVNSRNPINWVELSREFAILGGAEKAVKAMNVAVALAPTNRFVLRSAARLYIHYNNVERAHYLLKRAPNLSSDPWLLAAEIGTSALMNRSSRFIKVGRTQVDNLNFTRFEISELASALASLEIGHANHKFARQLFRKALVDPTENSIAQAEWASRFDNNIIVNIEKFDAPRKFEALTRAYYKDGRYDLAIKEGINWILDQPFAISPVAYTGSLFSIQNKFESSKPVYRFGLAANPGSATLLNDFAFSLASNDEPDEADIQLAKIDRNGLPVKTLISVTATAGLIQFRKGNFNSGRQLYRESVAIAEQNGQTVCAMRALVYLAREEVNAQTELAPASLERAELEFRNFISKEISDLLKDLKKQLENESQTRRDQSDP